MSEKRNNRFMSPLARARGLGSQHEGAHHWMMERITAVLLVPLVMWIVYSILILKGASYEAFIAWMQSPINAVVMMMFMVVSSYHAVMGLQVIMEDYISCHCTRMVGIVFVKVLFGVVAVASVFSILKVAL